MRSINTVVLAGLVACACGDAEPIRTRPDGGSGSMGTSFFPVAVGNRWTYRVISSSNVESTKIQTVVEEQTIDGAPVFVFETERANDRGTRSVQSIIDDKLVRWSEETLLANVVTARFLFSPKALRVDGNYTQTGESYSDTHDKHELDSNGNTIATVGKVHTFTIEADKDLITVPAGEFEAVRLRRDRNDGTSKTYWYVKGLGKVKEVGGQTEELVKAELGN